MTSTTAPDERPLAMNDPETGGSVGGQEPDEERLAAIFVEYTRLEPDDPRRGELRDALVSGYLAVARRLARRYQHRGVPLEDLEQVATLGLINAVDRFDPARGLPFLPFAIPTMSGEIRRYFRDHTWSMRVPRRLKDLQTSISKAAERLYQDLGRAPRPTELAARLDLPVAEVLEALEAMETYRSESLDEALDAPNPSSATLGEVLGAEDPGLERIEQHEALQPLLDELPERERSVIMLRFFANMSQSQIGERLGISQMHVSRLLAKTLAQLRQGLQAN